VDIAILFADIRGSTMLGARLGPAEYASALNRFYAAATEVLIRRDALVDKLIGDEVMALFIPGICGPDYRRKAAEAALALMGAVGYGRGREPWMPIGVAVNTASRLAASAAAGEILLGADVYEALAGKYSGAEERTLNLRGKEVPFPVHVLRAGQ